MSRPWDAPPAPKDDSAYRDGDGKLDWRKFPGLCRGCPNEDVHEAHIWEEPDGAEDAFCHGVRPPEPRWEIVKHVDELRNGDWVRLIREGTWAVGHGIQGGAGMGDHDQYERWETT